MPQILQVLLCRRRQLSACCYSCKPAAPILDVHGLFFLNMVVSMILLTSHKESIQTSRRAFIIFKYCKVLAPCGEFRSNVLLAIVAQLINLALTVYQRKDASCCFLRLVAIHCPLTRK